MSIRLYDSRLHDSTTARLLTSRLYDSRLHDSTTARLNDYLTA